MPKPSSSPPHPPTSTSSWCDSSISGGGGEPGASGANYWVQKQEDGSERWVNIGSRGQVDMKEGDRCVIHTPGGGGWGVPDDLEDDDEELEVKATNGVNGTNGTKEKIAYPRATGSFHTFSAAQDASS